MSDKDIYHTLIKYNKNNDFVILNDNKETIYLVKPNYIIITMSNQQIEDALIFCQNKIV